MNSKIINNIILFFLIFSSCTENQKTSQSETNSKLYYDFPVSTTNEIERLIKGKDIIGASINYDFNVSETLLLIYFNPKIGPIKLFDNSVYYPIALLNGDRFIKTKSLNIPIYSNEDIQFIKQVSDMFLRINSHRCIIITLNEKGYVLNSGTMGS